MNTHHTRWSGGLLKGPVVQDIVTEIELSERGSQTFPLENNLQYVSHKSAESPLGHHDVSNQGKLDVRNKVMYSNSGCCHVWCN